METTPGIFWAGPQGTFPGRPGTNGNEPLDEYRVSDCCSGRELTVTARGVVHAAGLAALKFWTPEECWMVHRVQVHWPATGLPAIRWERDVIIRQPKEATA